MLRLKSGRENEMDVLVARHQRKLIHFLERMVVDREAAEDLAQEVFLRVYLARHHYEPVAEFTTWLFCIAANQARKYISRERRFYDEIGSVPPRTLHRFSVERVKNPEQLALIGERRRKVRAAIRALPERQRDAIVLHRYEEREYSEIASRLECSVGAVKSLLFRTHSALRPRLVECGV
ncbi:MAG: sigma-70 family RNA polymerase sigma factor [Bryobacterales bacterium]|nr:sigma-70 family RNA polymerase sigma factor [Bryobacterales bacterium]